MFPCQTMIPYPVKAMHWSLTMPNTMPFPFARAGTQQYLILHITLLQPISDMTKEDEQLVLLYLMEHILLHIDEVLVH